MPLIDSLRTTEEKTKIQTITEIPVMLNHQGEIVCMEVIADMPIIGYFGKRSAGKSYAMHGDVDRIHHYRPTDQICILNDITSECKTWAYRNLDDLSKLNETGSALPIVFVYPNFTGMIQPDQQPWIKISIPFDFFIDNVHNFANLGQSADYIYSLKKFFINVTSPEELFAIIEDQIRNQKQVLSITVKINRFLEEGVVDLGTTDAVTMLDVTKKNFNMDWIAKSELTKNYEKYPKIRNGKARAFGPIQFTRQQEEIYKDMIKEKKGQDLYWAFRSRYMPIVSIMRCGLIPVVETSQLITKRYFQIYMKYFLDYLFENQDNNDYYKINEIAIWIVADELHRLKLDVLKVIAQTGRPKRIGFMWASQNYKKIDSVIRSQTNYLFVFKTNSSEDVNAIKADWDLNDEQRDKIKNLKTHEVLALSDTPFVIYSPDGTKYRSKEPQLGYSLPTLSRHKKPIRGKRK